jgi:hypothetical protein
MRLIPLRTLQSYAGIPNATPPPPPNDVEATSCLDVTAFTGPYIRLIAIWCYDQVLDYTRLD